MPGRLVCLKVEPIIKKLSVGDEQVLAVKWTSRVSSRLLFHPWRVCEGIKWKIYMKLYTIRPLSLELFSFGLVSFNIRTQKQAWNHQKYLEEQPSVFQLRVRWSAENGAVPLKHLPCVLERLLVIYFHPAINASLIPVLRNNTSINPNFILLTHFVCCGSFKRHVYKFISIISKSRTVAFERTDLSFVNPKPLIKPHWLRN